MREKVNLDFLCAKYGQEMVKGIERVKKSDIENMLQKSLGVLQEDGIYAFTVYLDSEGAFKDNVQGKEKAVKEILENVWNLLSDPNIALVNGECKREVVYPAFQRLSEDLNKLFLAKDLIERSLVYARYHARALPGK
jgi:hypothetical protein